MADDVDITGDHMAAEQEARDRLRGPDPYKPPPGIAGDCDLCGESSPRLIQGVCAPCRDKHKLP